MSNDSHRVPDEPNDGFSASWLSLREPADHLARSAPLDNLLAAWFKDQETHHVLELGAGTGSNLRYLVPQLGHNQYWTLLDNDARLFDCLPAILQSWAQKNSARFTSIDNQYQIEHADYSATIACKVVNLASQLDQLPMDNIQLLTASALLDLTSADWLETLAALINQHQCACLFALNYNGKIQWQPELEFDSTVSSLLNEHQLNDKGFGNALGPEAGHHFADALTQLGRQAKVSDSDWVVAPESQKLQHAIIDGWAPAAMEQDSQASDAIATWHTMRRQAIDQRTSTLTVGHIDVLSLP